ncbi:MAG: hypothetical protein WCP85_00120 [Mariniphaga sp.]
MVIDFPVPNVSIYYNQPISKLDNPLLDYPAFQVKGNELFMDVNRIARYLVRNGNEIFIDQHPEADRASVYLFLAGSAFGALLHQRNMLPLHGSSFVYNGKGVVICGASGAGKSSVVASFCQNGGIFINDDITPLNITDNETTIVPIRTRLKLWDDTLEKLNLTDMDLEKIRPTIEKFYLPLSGVYNEEKRFDQLYILSTHNKEEFIVKELSGVEKYNAIRYQIYRKIYLKGMPETEKTYFRQLLKLSTQVSVKQIVRPNICDVRDTMAKIRKEIGE